MTSSSEESRLQLNDATVVTASALSLTGGKFLATASAPIVITASTFSDSALQLQSSASITIGATITADASLESSVLDLTAPLIDLSGAEIIAETASNIPTVALASLGVGSELEVIGDISVRGLQLSKLSKLNMEGSLSIFSNLTLLQPIGNEMMIAVNGTLTISVSNHTITSEAGSLLITAEDVTFILKSVDEQLNALFNVVIGTSNLTILFDEAFHALNGTVVPLGRDIFQALPTLVNAIDSTVKLVLSVAERLYAVTIGSISCSPACRNGGTCAGLNYCDCPTGFGGIACACPTTSLPAFVTCSADLDLVAGWIISGSTRLSTSLIVPKGTTLLVQGDLELENGVDLELATSSSLVVQGTLSNDGGRIRVSPDVQPYSSANGASNKRAVPTGSPSSTTASPDTSSSCSFNMSSYITAQSLNLSSSSNITIYINMSTLVEFYGSDSGVTCLSTNSVINVTDNSTLDGIIHVIIIGDMAERRANASIVESGNPASSSLSSSLSLISSSDRSDTCSSMSKSPGMIALLVSPCASQESGTKLKWWYYGIPIIAVAVITVIIAIIILSIPRCRGKAAPYRGIRNG